MASEKRRLRTEMQACLRALAPARRALEEELAQSALQSDAAWRRAGTVLVHRSVGTEFSVVGATNGAWREGKRVLFPRVAGDRLVLHEVHAWSELRPGAFGIPEPAASSREVGPGDVEVALVPGVAWDAEGGRLGRGGGHYDRLLPRFGGAVWGVGFDCQVVARVPREPHDAAVQRVLACKLLGLP